MRSSLVVTLASSFVVVLAAACQSSTPTPSPVEAFATSPQPTAAFDCGSDVSLADPLHLSTGCSAGIDDSPVGKDEVTIVSSTLVVAQWMGPMCEPVKFATLDWESNGEVLTISEQSPPYPPNAPSCAGGVLPFDLHITLASPVSTNFRASVNDQVLQVVHAEPAETTRVSPSPLPAVAYVACDHRPGKSQPIRHGIVDETGLVIRCIETPYPVPTDGQISVTNPIDPLLLQVAWTAPCDAAITFTFSQSADGYRLVGEPASVCDANPPKAGLWVYLRAPVPAANVDVSFTSDPWPSRPPSAAPSH